jgi:hypothetical protein
MKLFVRYCKRSAQRFKVKQWRVIVTLDETLFSGLTIENSKFRANSHNFHSGMNIAIDLLATRSFSNVLNQIA